METWVFLCQCECFDKIVSECFHSSVSTFRTGRVFAQYFEDFPGAVFSEYGEETGGVIPLGIFMI